MINGIGCDLIEHQRIKRLLEKYHEIFLNRIYAASEIRQGKSYDFLSKKYVSYFAKRFCAKEAFSKALGSGIGKFIAFKHIEIENDERGKPFIKINKPVIKAINDIFGYNSLLNDNNLTNSEAKNNDNGRKFVYSNHYNGKMTNFKIHLSLADESSYSMAYVIIEARA